MNQPTRFPEDPNRLCGAPHNRLVVIMVEVFSCRRMKTSRKSSAALGPSLRTPKSSSTSRSMLTRRSTKARRSPVASASLRTSKPVNVDIWTSLDSTP